MGGGGRKGGRSLTKYHELLARGPKGCDFSGLEQGSLGTPLEPLGQEFTAVKVPLEEAQRIFLTIQWKKEEGGREMPERGSVFLL